MNYTELLNKIILESGLSAGKISKRCSELGFEVSATYLSQLRNQETRTPSEKVSRVLAKACGKDENYLIIQAFYDESPQAFREIIEKLRESFIVVITTLAQNDEEAEQAKKIFESMGIVDLILEIAKSSTDMVKQETGAVSREDMLNTNTEGYKVGDDAMSPQIPKGATVYTYAHKSYTEYKDGDIFCFHIIGDETFYVREVCFLNDEHAKFKLLSKNGYFPALTFEKKDIFLYGKVTSMFVEFCNR